MTTLCVLSHDDPHGRAAPHVLRHAELLAAVSDRLLVVSAAPLDRRAASDLGRVGEVLRRPGTTGDFPLWREGVRHLRPEGAHLLLVSHEAVGPFRDLRGVLAHAPDDGLLAAATAGWRETHLAHEVLRIGARAAADPVVAGFWTGVGDEGGGGPRRTTLLARDLGRLFVASGHQVVPAFQPRAAAVLQQDVRRRRQALGRWATSGGSARRRAARTLRRPYGVVDDPLVSYWSEAVHGRLPYLGLRALRVLLSSRNGEAALRSLSEARPEVMAGVREHLERTASSAPRRRRRVTA